MATSAATVATSAPASESLSTSSLSQSEVDALKVAVFQRLHPRAYLERFLVENIRPDKRLCDGFRDVHVNVGSISTANGSALVRMGNTTIICGIKAEISEPELDRDGDGFLVPNLDLPAMCSPTFKPGPPTEKAQVLSDRLNQVLTTSNILPLSSLCIHRGKSVWVLYVDATCINYDGNAFDATLLAMVAALKNTTLPQATFDPEKNITICSRRAPKSPLQLNPNTPISVSFGIFDSKHVLADPTSFEEPLLDTSISVVVGEQGDLISVSQFGSTLISQSGGLSRDTLPECITSAKRRREILSKQIFK